MCVFISILILLYPLHLNFYELSILLYIQRFAGEIPWCSWTLRCLFLYLQLVMKLKIYLKLLFCYCFLAEGGEGGLGGLWHETNDKLNKEQTGKSVWGFGKTVWLELGAEDLVAGLGLYLAGGFLCWLIPVYPSIEYLYKIC